MPPPPQPPAGAPPARIALCITSLHAGGAERCLAELAARLPRSRFAPHVYSLAPPPGDDQPSVVPLLERAAVPISYLHATGQRHAAQAVFRLAKLFRQQRPHLLQTFLFHANLVGRLAAWRAGVPLVLSGIRVAERRHRWYLWLDRLTSLLVDRYVCVSQAVQEFSASRGGLAPGRLLVIPNGVDVERFAAAAPADLTQLGIRPGREIFIYVGRLDEQKRVDWLLSLSPAWMARLPSHDLLVVGDGPHRASLQQLCKRLGIEQRVYWLGWRSDIPELLAASQALLLPSAWEGMPNVVLEAMAAGRPVISTDVEGVAELLDQDGSPQIADSRQPSEFAAKIVALGSNRELAGQIGMRNRARAWQFSLDAMVRRYAELFESLIHKTSPIKD